MRTYGRVERRSNTWVLLDVEPHVVLRLKAVFPRIPKTARGPFFLGGGEQVDADLAWFMDRYPLIISAEDRAFMQQRKTLFERGQAELGFLLSKDWKPSAAVRFRDGCAPYNYQSQAAELTRRKGRLLLMDDLGLGKTISALATICDPDYLPALIVPQTHLTKQWAAKVREFTHLTTHTIKYTTPYELPKSDIYICPYSKLGGWIDYAERSGFRSVIFDEMQELRNGQGTSKGKAAFAFRQSAALTMGLTATPIYNYGSEIFQIVDILEPGALGEWGDFCIEWCSMGPGGKWIVKDPQALGTYLREQHLALRRTDVEVGGDMPPLNVITHSVPFDDDVLDNEDAAIRALAHRVMTGSFTDRGMAAREFDMRLRHATGIAKAPHVAAFVRLLLDAKQPVVLAGWHRDVYDIWLTKLARYNPLLYTGTESPTQKERTKDAFVAGKSNLMIMSLRSGAGLDGLQERCHTIVFGELDWSPQVHAQCCGRLRRPGQRQQVDAFYLHADGGSDPSVLGVLGLKASQSHGIVDPLSTPTDQHSDTTRIRLLAERYLAGAGETLDVPELEAQAVPQVQMGLFA